MKTINPDQLKSFSGRIIDVRNPDEFSAERLAQASCVPLPTLAVEASKWNRGESLLLMCKSGMRSKQACNELAAAGFSDVTMLAGGIEACKKAGVNVVVGNKTIPIMRQVMIVAGSLLLIGLVLGMWYPAFRIIDWFVACGLLFAGLTGNCLMAMLLDKMPWNKVSASPSSLSSSCCEAGRQAKQQG